VDPGETPLTAGQFDHARGQAGVARSARRRRGHPGGSRLNSSTLAGCAAETDCYAQVWLRPDGTYQLEYRDRAPGEHYQTRTVSAEKVITALSGWVAGETQWRDAFQWTCIGAWFDQASAPADADPAARE